MEEPHRDNIVSTSSSSSSGDSVEYRGSSGTAASTSSSLPSQVREQEENRDRRRSSEIEHHHIGISYTADYSVYDDSSRLIREDTWSCLVVVLTFWFFVSMTMILGVYGSLNIRLGPETSLLIQPNPIFVQNVKVEDLDGAANGLALYGLYKIPPLDVVVNWSEILNASVSAFSYKEWIYYLKKGAQVNISYNINSLSSLYIIIAQGNEGLSQWLDDPTYPNTTLSWNIVHGKGMIQQDIYKSSSYYVAVGNLNSEEVEVQLELQVRSLVYNTSDAYFKCSLDNGPCNLKLFFPLAPRNVAVLTSSDPDRGTHREGWTVKLSYGPRWNTYIVGIGGMTALMILAFNFLNKLPCRHEDERTAQSTEIRPERAPLLSPKDDDLSSCDNESVSHDEEDPEDWLAKGSIDGKPLLDGDNDYLTRRLCAICYDAPRDCFFFPCGHCVACVACGTRIAEETGTCPICRRNIRKVRKIFTV